MTQVISENDTWFAFKFRMTVPFGTLGDVP